MKKTFNVSSIRKDFPILQRMVHDRPLIYLDNAATSLKPKCVVDAINEYYLTLASNVHRGIHHLSEQATIKFEATRKAAKEFINAEKLSEVIFTKGVTGSINLVAQSYGRTFLKSGDEIIISHMEHHSNIVPWQMLCKEKGCVLKVIPINDRGELILEEFDKLLGPRTKFVSLVYISNSLGTINPVKDIIQRCHEKSISVLIDAAQSAHHLKIDVQDLDCDFLAFSSHKIYGPTGVGVLYGKEKWLKEMPPLEGGGDMILSVTFEKTEYNILPQKFEAGTPNIAGVIGLGKALDYVSSLGIENIQEHERKLLEYGTKELLAIPGLKLIGTAKRKSAILSFVIDGIHPHDIGSILDQGGVAIRTGHHCTMPVMQRFNIPATARASLACYNTKEDIDILVKEIYKVKEVFS